MSSFRVHILAASHTFFDGDCESLIVPTSEGAVRYSGGTQQHHQRHRTW